MGRIEEAPKATALFFASLSAIAAQSPAGQRFEPDRGNLRHDRFPLPITADPSWHFDAVGRRSHPQIHMKQKSNNFKSHSRLIVT